MSPLTMPSPKSGGGGSYTDQFRVSKTRHKIRVFAYEHDGEDHLAKMHRIHFVDGKVVPFDPAIQAEAKKTGNKRLNAVTRYAMAVVDTEADKDTILKWDCPTSAYRQIFAILSDEDTDAEDILGNQGQDFIINNDRNAEASAQYSVTLRQKGSVELEIDDDDVPDLWAEIEEDGDEPLAEHTTDEEEEAPAKKKTAKKSSKKKTAKKQKKEEPVIDAGVTVSYVDDDGDAWVGTVDDINDDDIATVDWGDEYDPEEIPVDKLTYVSDESPKKRGQVDPDGEPESGEDDGANIVFKDEDGNHRRGVYSGKKRKGKLLVEYDGALMQVAEDDVVEHLDED